MKPGNLIMIRLSVVYKEGAKSCGDIPRDEEFYLCKIRAFRDPGALFLCAGSCRYDKKMKRKEVCYNVKNAFYVRVRYRGTSR